MSYKLKTLTNYEMSQMYYNFAPVARMSSIRLLVSLAAIHDMKIEQLDVANAYLNGTLEQKVMRPPTNLANILESLPRVEGKC